MKIAYFGDVVGRPGRNAIIEHLPRLKADLNLDFVVVNAENAAGGFGLTETIANEFFAAGADCLTLGDHAWDQREALTYIEREDRLLRPLNYPGGKEVPGRGSHMFTLPNGARVGVILVQGTVFMRQILDNPFQAIESALESMPLGTLIDALIVDMHCEATSEKMAMGHYCDGRASLVVGSHTHVPTADWQILPGGTAYLTDAGMCGDYDSVIGMCKENSVQRFATQLPGARYQPALGEGTLCGVYIETETGTGLARHIAPIRVGGRLMETCPER